MAGPLAFAIILIAAVVVIVGVTILVINNRK